MSALILIVDDEPGARKVAKANLSLEGFEVVTAASGRDALGVVQDCDPMAVVTDLKMPDVDGITLMTRIHALRPGLPVILATAHATVDTAVHAMRQGALNYLTKPLRFDELAVILQHAVEAERSRRELETLRGALDRAKGFEDMVGETPCMQRVFSLVDQVADTSATVLIQGATGTGKELVARALHRRSSRRDRRFVAVNCSAIPAELVESEFFGHEKGAFTGASGRRQGCFEQADGSTLFLDEVGELDAAFQAKLLRVLQDGTFTRIGGTRAIQVDARIVVATNRNLAEEVTEGRFRDDLFYRINVIPIELPPLRERAADIPRLMRYFLSSFAQRYGREVPPPDPVITQTAIRYTWPGNVRELRNLCERAVLLGWPAVEPLLRPVDTAAEPEYLSMPFPQAKQLLVADFEQRYLRRLLREHGGRIGAAATAAGMAERNLREKMTRYEIKKADFR